ncbi:MAG: hypothetical protein FH758_03310 [Firmicutes bacterium]|nr:hypothetical protein [Bacillota bacterium]
MAQTHFFVHDKEDHVGVAVVDIKAGEEVNGWVMENDDTVTVKSVNDIPLGHKISLKDLDQGTKVLKYNVVIGGATQAVKTGEHVHTHNLKTLRW